MMEQPSTSPHNVRLAIFWAISGALGTLAVFPYLITLNPPPADSLPIPLSVLALLSTLQSGLLLFVLSWIGLRLGRSLGLDSPLARALVTSSKFPTLSKSGILVALIVGTAGGALVLGLAYLFDPLLPPVNPAATLDIALWKRALASFYGGITEELLLRLFLMTLIAWILWKLGLRTENRPTPLTFWLAIALSALLFGAGHLPTAAALWGLTTIVVVRTLLLNSLVAIAFGFLYWQWGLEYAMLSHFWADIVLHVIGGS